MGRQGPTFAARPIDGVLRLEQFSQRACDAAKIVGGHCPGVPTRRDGAGVGRVIRQRNRDESIDAATMLEEVLGGQRRSSPQHVVGEDEQAVEVFAEKPLPLGETLQIIAGRPVLPEQRPLSYIVVA
jgi:hypothetical protein